MQETLSTSRVSLGAREVSPTRSLAAVLRGLGPRLMVAPGLLLVGVIFLAPLAYMGYLSVTDPTPGLENYLRLVQAPAYLKVTWFTIQTALTVTLLGLLLSYPVAYTLSPLATRWANLLLIAVILPYFVSFLIRTYAWMVILGREGVINMVLRDAGVIERPLRLMFNTFGVYVGMLNVMTPIMILVLYGVMRGIDRDLVRAARNLGATPMQAFVRVFLPLSMPGVGSACLLVFILSLGFYITPALLGGEQIMMVSTLIVSQVNELFNWGFASALSLALLTFVGLTYWVLRPFAGIEQAIGAGGPLAARATIDDGHSWWAQAGAAVQAVLSPIGLAIERAALTLGTWLPGWLSARNVRWVITAAVLFYLVAPILVVIPLSFSDATYLTFPPPGFSLRWYEAFLGNQAWIDATLFSVRVGLAAAAIALTLGLLATVALVRFNLSGRKVIFILLILPIVVPEIITALAIYFVFARVQFTGTLFSIAIAQSILALPYVVLVVSPALRNLDSQFEQAARSLGAGPWRTFRFVIFPLLRPSIVAAALFGFLASFDNLLVGLFLAGPGAITLPIKMWEGLRLEINPLIASVSTIQIVLSIVILLGAGQIRWSRLTSPGRGATAQ
ncbi:MAG: ABC transporter permease subunit [Thermomicrobiales bacterium]